MSQQSRNTRISRESLMDTTEERAEHLMSEIEEMREGIIVGMLLEALERACVEPDFLKFLRDLIELEGEAEAERFERGNLKSMDYVDAVDLLRRAESPDDDDVPDEKLESGDESEGGEESEGPEAPEEPEEVGEKRKRKGKSKAAPKKPQMDREERDDSSGACNRCKERLLPCIVLKGKTACDACHQVHTKCSLQLQSKTRLPQKKASRVAQAFAQLGLVGAVVYWPASQVSSRRRQIDSRTGEIIPEEISQFEEMRRGLRNASDGSSGEGRRGQRGRPQWSRKGPESRNRAKDPEELVVPRHAPHTLRLALRDRVRAQELRFLRLSFRWFPRWTTRTSSG
ncbi:hypothetical protein DFH08DRAFT_819489 [Mycena albidolilacea]|uniref:Uncharacterized protein n=1 Tax=Mycena albidolilacea TaxID=1033008 RepID=A0AAD6ZEG3_9AGAR|nr:hypothetical protein DFH08DRAFT_819489 [Mycena albidolilacea]